MITRKVQGYLTVIVVLGHHVLFTHGVYSLITVELISSGISMAMERVTIVTVKRQILGSAVMVANLTHNTRLNYFILYYFIV